MRTPHVTRLRALLAVLLAGSAILFLIGSTIERSHRHQEEIGAAGTARASTGEGSESSGEGSESQTHSDTGATETGYHESGARILGVDTESLALSIAAVVVSLLLAAAVVLERGRRSKLVLLGVVGFGLVFAAGDARELVHQLDESNNGLAAVAAVLLALHLGISALAGLVLLRERSAGTAVAQPA